MDKKQLVKLISSFVMVDGGLYKKSNKGNCYYMMNMLEANRDYVEYVASILDHITSTTIVRFINHKNSHKLMLRLTSKCHPFFNPIWDRIYTPLDEGGRYKGLDWHALKQLDWETLAIFYMCDGGLYIDKPNPKKGLINESYSVFLHLKRLSYGDIFLFKKLLKEKLNLEWNINKHNYNGKTYFLLRLRIKDLVKFMDGVRPYIFNSFYYKLLNSERLAPYKEKYG